MQTPTASVHTWGCNIAEEAKAHWSLAVKWRLRWQWCRPQEVAFPLSCSWRSCFPALSTCPAPVKRVKTCSGHSFSSGGHSHTTCNCAYCLLATKRSVKTFCVHAITIRLSFLMDQVQQIGVRSILTPSTLSASIFTPLKKSRELNILGHVLPPERTWDLLAVPSACGSGTSSADCCAFSNRSFKAVEHWIQGQFREIAFLITGQEFSCTSFTLAWMLQSAVICMNWLLQPAWVIFLRLEF